jgi:hypothetical protein
MRSDLVSHLSLVKDPRSEKNKLYPLEEILLLCVCPEFDSFKAHFRSRPRIGAGWRGVRAQTPRYTDV